MNAEPTPGHRGGYVIANTASPGCIPEITTIKNVLVLLNAITRQAPAAQSMGLLNIQS